MLKKAQESVGTPVSLVLVLAAIAVLAILLLVILAPKILKLPDREICKLSVIARSKTTMMGMESDLPLNCRTNFITVKKDGIYEDGNIEVRFNKGEKPSEKEEKIKRYIANQMYDCWYQFNKGQSDPWGDWHLGTRVHCMICADINFEEEFREEVGKIKDFGEFLNKEKVSLSKETYSEYFGGKLEMEEDIYINTSQPYLVLYRLQDQGVGGGIWGLTFAGCTAGSIAAAFGPIGWTLGVGGGCVVGFGTGVYRYIFGANEVDLQAGIFFVPAEVVKPGFCHRIG